MVQHAFALEQSAVQVWVKNSEGLDDGHYYARATANSPTIPSESYFPP